MPKGIVVVRASVRLALPQGTCELPYQYRGHFSRPESLIGIFRQVTMIIRDKILRFAEKFEKKFFATSFFRTKIYLCLSELKKTPSIKILRALWLVCPSWHTWPVSANENRENRPATKWVRPRMRNWSRHVFPSMSAETEDLSRIIPIWSHLDQNKVSTFVIAQPFCSSDNVLCTCPNFELLEPQFIVVFGDFIFLPGSIPHGPTNNSDLNWFQNLRLLTTTTTPMKIIKLKVLFFSMLYFMCLMLIYGR